MAKECIIKWFMQPILLIDDMKAMASCLMTDTRMELHVTK